VLAAKALDQRHGQHRAHRGRHSDHDIAARVGAQCADLGFGARDGGEDTLGVLVEQAAGLGHDDAAAVAMHELDAQFLLERAHLPAEHRLHHAQDCGRAREAAKFGHRREGFQFFDVHRAVVLTPILVHPPAS
jgi:hypothetical protein